MTTNVIAFLPSPEPTTTVRSELRAAIADRNEAWKDADAAKAIFDQALASLGNAQAQEHAIREDFEAQQKAAIEANAVAAANAFRAGKEAPPTVLPRIDSEALTFATARCQALQQACDQLRKEHERLSAVAGGHCHRVTELIDKIMVEEAKALAYEVIEAQRTFERLYDRLAGICIRDGKRPGGPLLHRLQAEVVARLHRQRRETAKNPQLIEKHKWHEFLSNAELIEEKAWKAYAQRLADNADAQFEPPATATQDNGAAA